MMSRASALLKNSYVKGLSFSFFGNLSNSISQWIIFSFIAKKFGTVELGSYSLAIAWILPLYAFFSLQLRNVHVSDQNDEYGFSTFYTLRVISSILFFVTVTLIGAIFYEDTFIVFLVLGVTRAFELVSDIFHAEFHRRKQIVTFSKRLLWRSFFTIIFTLITFQFIKRFEVALISIPLAYFINMVFDYILLRKEIGAFHFTLANKELLKKLLVTGIIIGVSLLLVYLLPSIPRFVLEKFRDKTELGLFSGYMYLIIFARLFVQAMTQNSLPHLASYYSNGNMDGFKKHIYKEIGFLTVIGLLQFIIIPMSDYIFPILYNKDFVGNKNLLLIIFTGSLFSFIAFSLNNALNAMKMFRVQLPIYSILVLISLIFAYLLIPKYGIIGAGAVFMISAFFQCVFLLFVLLNNIRSKNKL